MSLTDFIEQAKKAYGKDIIRRYDDGPLPDIDVIPTGSLVLDSALGVGGWPRGRVTEIIGNAGSGKTTMALHAIKEAQKLGHQVMFVDVEHALDPFYAQAIGVDMNELYITQPNSGEEALNVVRMAIENQAFELMVIDSVAALVPTRELEGEMEDSHMGLQARLLHKFVRTTNGPIRKHNIAMILINQYRANMNTMGFGSNKVAAGGSALEYATSIKADVSRIKSIQGKSGNIEAHRTRVKIMKNKVAPPFQLAEFDIIFGEGINQAGELIDMGVELGIISKGGAWYTYDEYKVQGRDKFTSDLKTVADLRKLLEDDIKRLTTSVVDREDKEGAVSE